MNESILVRMDDICETMNWEKFQKCYSMLKKYDVKPLLAIVPFPKDEKIVRGNVPDFWKRVKELQEDGCVIAVHGFEHLYTSSEHGLVCERPLSEFAGVPYDRQLLMLKEGKKELVKHGIETDWFCAPGHSYDRNTIKALKNAGYKYMSDGRSMHPYVLDGIKCIPADSAWRLHKFGMLTICMHPNEETESSLAKLEKYLVNNQSRIISFHDAEVLETKPYVLCRFEEHFSIYFRKVLERVIRKIK